MFFFFSIFLKFNQRVRPPWIPRPSFVQVYMLKLNHQPSLCQILSHKVVWQFPHHGLESMSTLFCNTYSFWNIPFKNPTRFEVTKDTNEAWRTSSFLSENLKIKMYKVHVTPYGCIYIVMQAKVHNKIGCLNINDSFFNGP